MKLPGILSTTHNAVADKFCNKCRYSLASAGSGLAPCFVSRVPGRYRADALVQNGSSPAPNTDRCEEMICSARVVPERNIPMMNTGRCELIEFNRAPLNHCRSKAWMIRSTLCVRSHGSYLAAHCRLSTLARR